MEYTPTLEIARRKLDKADPRRAQLRKFAMQTGYIKLTRKQLLAFASTPTQARTQARKTSKRRTPMLYWA